MFSKESKMSASYDKFPYLLPDNNKDAVVKLGEILEIHPNIVENDLIGKIDDKLLIETMSGIIMYNFLDPAYKKQVRDRLSEIEDNGRRYILERRLYYTTQNRGAWSLTPNELDSMVELRSKVHRFGDITGLSFSILSLADLADKVYEKVINKREVPVRTGIFILISVSMWGFFLQNDKELARLQREIENRSERLDADLARQ